MSRKPRTQPDDERTVYVLSDDDPSLAPKRVSTTTFGTAPTSDHAPTLKRASLALPDPEPRAKRILFHSLAISILVAYAYFLLCFFAPAPSRPGIDENAYLVAGRMIADHGSPSLKPPHPLSFVGAMWVQSPTSGLFYPKYPAGLSYLYAILLKLFGRHGTTACFLLSPACAVLSAYATFLLARRITTSFAAILSMIVLATGITTLELAHQPNSHLPCLAVVTLGMYFLVRYVQTARTRWGVIAGFLLGFAVSIRYSQGLLALPLAAACLMHLRPRTLKSWLRVSAPLLAWAIPVGALALFNWVTMRHLSGYGATRESTGFTLAEFFKKWEFGVAQLHNFGLFFIAAPGLVGLVLLFRRNWRVATLLFLWFVPGTLLYFSYYWGQQAPGVAFLRFFLDLFPAIIIPAFWLVHAAGQSPLPTPPQNGDITHFPSPNPQSAIRNPQSPGSLAAPLAAALLCAITSAVSLRSSLPELSRQHVGNLNLAFSGQRLLSRLRLHPSNPPSRPVIFADEGLFPQFLMYAQFLTDADFYAPDAFIPRFGGGFGILGFKRADKDDSPVLIQEKRRDDMDAYYKARSTKDLVREQQSIMSAALDQGRPVYAILTPLQLDDFKKTFLTPPFQSTLLDKWTEPAGNPIDPPNRPLSPTSWRINLIINWTPQTRHLIQITRATPTTQPTP